MSWISWSKRVRHDVIAGVSHDIILLKVGVALRRSLGRVETEDSEDSGDSDEVVSSPAEEEWRHPAAELTSENIQFVQLDDGQKPSWVCVFTQNFVHSQETVYFKLLLCFKL